LKIEDLLMSLHSEFFKVKMFVVSDKKTPNRFRSGAKIKRHGPDSPAHDVGDSFVNILSAADRRRDWLPGGGCNMKKYFQFHSLNPTCNYLIQYLR